MIKITIKIMNPKINSKCGSYFVLICVIFYPALRDQNRTWITPRLDFRSDTI